MYISVYGTLRRGQGANYMLDEATFIGETVELLPFTMYHLGGFPALILNPKEEKKKITIETYKINDGDRQTPINLDRYEGYPHLYQKREIVLKSGIISTIYYMVKSDSKNIRVIENGDWCAQIN